MRNNDIMDEDFGKEVPDNQQRAETPWIVTIAGVVLAGCVLSVVVALTLRLDKWLLH